MVGSARRLRQPPATNHMRGRDTYHHGNLRSALLAAARAIVATGGAGALTLRAAAERVGVSHAAPYRHFPGRDALVAALAAEGFGELRARMERALGAAPTEPAARLLALGEAYLGLATDEPGLFRVMFSPEAAERARYPELMAADDRAFAVLSNEVAASQRAGALPAGDPIDVAILLWTLIHGVAVASIDGLLARRGLSPVPPRELLARGGAVVLQGLDRAARPARRRK